MANPPCMSEDGNAAVFTGTNFETGQSVMLCGPCLVSFCATIVEGMTGLPVSALLDSADELGAPSAQSEDDEDTEDTEDEQDAEDVQDVPTDTEDSATATDQ